MRGILAPQEGRLVIHGNILDIGEDGFRFAPQQKTLMFGAQHLVLTARGCSFPCVLVRQVDGEFHCGFTPRLPSAKLDELL